jgi:excinuclease UvrABC nuclease subunit
MQKSKINLTLDLDLIEFAKNYAKYQRTSVSEIISQFLLNLKRSKEHEPTEIIMSDPDFKESLLQTISRIRSGDVKWHTYQEVFDGSSR